MNKIEIELEAKKYIDCMICRHSAKNLNKLTLAIRREAIARTKKEGK